MLLIWKRALGNVFNMMRAVGSNVLVSCNTTVSLEQGGGLQILQFVVLIVEIVGWVNGYQEALIQINRYDNDYRVKHIRQYFPTHYEEDSNDGISMISRKPHHKIDNTSPRKFRCQNK
jgi:hypothetical protein